MARTLYFCVVQGYDDNWFVMSFGGKNKTEEKRFALTCYRRCVLVTTDHATATRSAEEHRRFASAR